MQKLEQSKAQGFMWSNELWNTFEDFKNSRTQYPYFKDYLPIIAKRYNELI